MEWKEWVSPDRLIAWVLSKPEILGEGSYIIHVNVWMNIQDAPVYLVRVSIVRKTMESLERERERERERIFNENVVKYLIKL
jgi:hypothetical protein